MAGPELHDPDERLDVRGGPPPPEPPSRARRGWRRFKWPLMLAGISGGIGALLSFGLTGAGVG